MENLQIIRKVDFTNPLAIILHKKLKLHFSLKIANITSNQSKKAHPLT